MRFVHAAVVLCCFALAVAAGPVSEQAYERVADRLMCQCGCGQTVRACNHYQCSSAGALRQDVRQALASASNEDRAVEVLLQKWGVKILAEPPKTGFQLTAWVAPFAVLIGGLLLISAILRHWRRRTLALPRGVDPGLLARYEERIDREADAD